MIDHYPLPETPPLELSLQSFTAVVDFDFDLDTFAGSSASFTIAVEAGGSGSTLGPSRRSLSSIDTTAESTTVYSTVSLSSELRPILESQDDPRIVYTAYDNNGGVFAEREEFVIENNRSNFLAGSVMVLEARLTGGAIVSDLSGVVTLTFEKTPEVWGKNVSWRIFVKCSYLFEGYGERY